MSLSSLMKGGLEELNSVGEVWILLTEAMLTAENTSWHFPLVGPGRKLRQWPLAAQLMESMKQVDVLVHVGWISQGPKIPEEKLQDFNGCWEMENQLSPGMSPPHCLLISSAHSQTQMRVSDIKQTQQVIFMNAHACVGVLTYVSMCKTTIIIKVEEAMNLRKSWGHIGEEEKWYKFSYHNMKF